MKYPIFVSIVVTFSAILLASCGSGVTSESSQAAESQVQAVVQADVMGASGTSDLDVDYEKVDEILADITAQMHQPNILKDDILRGWYLGGKTDRKYGTPATWIFVEDGANSKWISPNSLEEEDLIDEQQLCKQTAGSYMASCLDTSDADCEYINESHCECSAGTKWRDDQGCILVTDKGSFVSITNADLDHGFYLGFPNQKKLNTPSDWLWVEKGRQSMWQKSN